MFYRHCFRIHIWNFLAQNHAPNRDFYKWLKNSNRNTKLSSRPRKIPKINLSDLYEQILLAKNCAFINDFEQSENNLEKIEGQDFEPIFKGIAKIMKPVLYDFCGAEARFSYEIEPEFLQKIIRVNKPFFELYLQNLIIGCIKTKQIYKEPIQINIKCGLTTNEFIAKFFENDSEAYIRLLKEKELKHTIVSNLAGSIHSASFSEDSQDENEHFFENPHSVSNYALKYTSSGEKMALSDYKLQLATKIPNNSQVSSSTRLGSNLLEKPKSENAGTISLDYIKKARNQPAKIPYFSIEILCQDAVYSEEECDQIFIKYPIIIKYFDVILKIFVRNNYKSWISNLKIAREIFSKKFKGKDNISIKEEILSYTGILSFQENYFEEIPTFSLIQQNSVVGDMNSLIISNDEKWRSRVKNLIEENEGNGIESDNIESLNISMYEQEKVRKYDNVIIDGRNSNNIILTGIIKGFSEKQTSLTLLHVIPIIICDMPYEIPDFVYKGISLHYPNLFLISDPLNSEKIANIFKKGFMWNVKQKFAEEYQIQNNEKAVAVLSKDENIKEIIEQISSRSYCEIVKFSELSEILEILKNTKVRLRLIIILPEFISELSKLIPNIPKNFIKVVVLTGNLLDKYEKFKILKRYPNIKLIENILELCNYLNEILK